MSTTERARSSTSSAAPPAPDVRRFWRVLLAVIAPVPMLAMGAYWVLRPVDGGASFVDTVAAYSADDSRIQLLTWLQVPFLVLLTPAVFAVVWVTRRHTPRLTTAGALVALTGTFAGFGLLAGASDLAVVTAQEGLDVATAARIDKAGGEDPTVLLGGLLFILAITVGLLLLGIALWRSRVVPAGFGLALAVGGFTHPFMPGHVASGIGLVVAAIGFAGATVALLRMSDDDFDLAPVAATAARDRVSTAAAAPVPAR